MNKTSPDTSVNALSTWQLDEHPGDSALNANWQKIASKLDEIDQILAGISGYATQTSLNNEIAEREAQDQFVFTTAARYTDDCLSVKADVVDIVSTKQVVQGAQSLFNGTTEITADNVATKSYVNLQNQATGLTADILTTVGLSGGGEYYTKQVWLRYVNGALKAWSPPVNYAVLAQNPSYWLTGEIDITLLGE